ncbi:MAG TPA: AfsR/SARP family transcriptional regulator [Actinophytocola sp.]|uniref:AfsR/SARP family transcriptional regulator n=1 Tax=Actinophytocola sp. TaxID=1872138 RepID=UPI002DDD97DC|nr:AfsR/SARP family transcriptional regulator [Actinophytocola sp.]HEV2782801.1 AfsR/SARP family transcriptional regulator [Actinophytocola sp.]
MLRYRVLGPIEIQADDGPVEIPGRFQRTLLAALLVNTGRLVMAHSLVDELWGAHPPGNSENALQAHVSRLRRTLTKAQPHRSAPHIVSLPSGYRLLVEPDEVDADRFIRAVGYVRSRPDLDPAETTRRLRDALALWRGAAFGGDIGGFICQAAAIRYDEHRSSALELLFETELLIGRHAQVIAELSEFVESDSVNEKLCAQLMVALYRAGRQTDALALYRRVRGRLADELGIEPSPTLRNCERAILSHDPMLEARSQPIALRG